ncbi:MAG: hypothetical protein HDR29_02525 [Lachnospiraceae bacterium]|nr:hypothetical protein [Lachnospiraceae bacterium]
MRINYNASAMRANNALNVADNRVSSSLRKLSSGYKVNSAKDNPSGYAIGRRMDTQIEGVSVATRNANTGISIIETADGALTEVHDMLQRMNELAIKGATGTMTTADRAIVNEEVAQLKEEVARIARDTEFNGQTLLDGCFDLKGYTNDLSVKVGYYSDEVLEKVYTVDALKVFYNEDGKIDLDKTKDSFRPGANFPEGVEIYSVGENCVTIKGDNDFEITLDIDENSLVKGKEISDRAGLNISSYSDAFEAGAYKIDLAVFYDDKGILQNAMLTDYAGTPGLLGNPVEFSVDDVHNQITIKDDKGDDLLTVDAPAYTGTTPVLATVAFDVDDIGEEMIADISNLKIDITGIGAMDTQIGANEGQSLEIRIPTISLQRLGITNMNLLTQDSSSDAIVAIKSAISYVSSVRSRLGAYQNRLEHTVSSLDITNENMTAAYSRIMDVDMSEEMTNYTTQQVVEQAAVSMLAQANERPSQVLQLLQ